MVINPNRVTLYMTDPRREKARHLAQQLTESGTPGLPALFDQDGNVRHSTLYLWLIEDKLGEHPSNA